jgi:hypothetical protein
MAEKIYNLFSDDFKEKVKMINSMVMRVDWEFYRE